MLSDPRWCTHRVLADNSVGVVLRGRCQVCTFCSDDMFRARWAAVMPACASGTMAMMAARRCGRLVTPMPYTMAHTCKHLPNVE